MLFFGESSCLFPLLPLALLLVPQLLSLAGSLFKFALFLKTFILQLNFFFFFFEPLALLCCFPVLSLDLAGLFLRDSLAFPSLLSLFLFEVPLAFFIQLLLLESLLSLLLRSKSLLLLGEPFVFLFLALKLDLPSLLFFLLLLELLLHGFGLLFGGLLIASLQEFDVLRVRRRHTGQVSHGFRLVNELLQLGESVDQTRQV